MAQDCRLYLAGHLTLEASGGTLRPGDLPRRQGRLALAHLGMQRGRLVTREDLAATLWPPEEDETSSTSRRSDDLSVVVSKLRRSLASVGLDEAIQSTAGCYVLRLPADTWVDIEVATVELDAAEGALRRDDARTAWAPATVATAILRRPFMPGEDVPWVLGQRRRLAALRLRATDALTRVWLDLGEGSLAQRAAEEAVDIAPFREVSHRLLMQAHLAQGNRAEAILAFHRCRDLLTEELGVEPDEETRHVYEEALG